MTENIPTAYCYQLTAEAFPLVTVQVDNTGQGCGNAAVYASAVIEDYSSPDTKPIGVMQGKNQEVALLPQLKHAEIKTLSEMHPASLHVCVENAETGQCELYNKTHPIRLHAYDTALLARTAPDGSMVDLSDYLAAWVTPHHPAVERLLRQAADYLPHGFVGYLNMGTAAQSAAYVRQQAQAIFTALQEKAQLKYVNSPLNLGKEPGQITQRVRLPADCLEVGGSANCIDGTVLFASLLALASLDPVLVLVPRHAFVGWKKACGSAQYEFVETTMIGTHGFQDAQREGERKYRRTLAQGDFSRGIYDPGGFAKLIDVRACFQKGILPLG